MQIQKWTRLAGSLLASGVLVSLAAIGIQTADETLPPASPPAAEVPAASETTTAAALPQIGDAADETYPIPSYPVVALDVPPVDPEQAMLRVEAEDAEYTGQLKVDDQRMGFTGRGYLTGFSKQEEDSVKAVFQVPASQHYNVTISVCSDTPVVNYLQLNGEDIGEFRTEEEGAFVRVTFPGIYIPAGEATISVREEDGYFSIDYFELSSYHEMYDIPYLTEYPLSDPDASDGAKQLMAYLTENYGKKILTGQYAAGEADTELELIHRLTGKYPAIRFGDMESYTANSSAEDTDVIGASQRWAEQGGIVGLMWHWDAPSGVSSVYAEQTDFSLLDALPPYEVETEYVPVETQPTNAQTDDPGMQTQPEYEEIRQFVFSVDVAEMEIEDVDALVQAGTVPEGCAALLRDIDSVSEALAPLAEQDIPVLWRPLHEAGGDWFWWGAGGAEAYRWLWDVMYRRMTVYHGLHNLIWIWNGQDADYLTEQYDIAGADVYLSADKPFGSRYEQFVSLSRMTGGQKLLALSECSTVPDMNQMFRDNTIWSFFGLWYGEYLIDENGSYSDAYTAPEDMIAVYNSEAALTLTDAAARTETTEQASS